MAKPSGDPFQDMCTMIGLMTLVWAWIENTLAIAIGTINLEIGPIKGYPEPPIALKKRVACLRVALRDIAVLKPLQDEGRALATRVIELSPRRHEIIHGAAWQIEKDTFESTSIIVQAGQNVIKNHRFNQADAVRLNEEIAKLQDDLAIFLTKLLAILSK